MENHNLFYSVAAFIFVAAVIMAFFVSWASTPFFLFALAAAVRGMSLHKGNSSLRTVAYIVFALGMVLLIYYFTVYQLLGNDSVAAETLADGTTA